MAESTPEVGNYYAPEDYAGVFRRFVISVVDWLFVLIVFFAVKVVHFKMQGGMGDAFTTAELWGWLAFLYVYFVVLEASSLGTLGYLLTGVRIVDLQGKRPAFHRMLVRLLLMTRGPIFMLVDFVWLTGDEYKQTLRDKFAGTVVVRKKAVPAGVGELRLNRYQVFCYSLVFYEVKKPA